MRVDAPIHLALNLLNVILPAYWTLVQSDLRENVVSDLVDRRGQHHATSRVWSALEVCPFLLAPVVGDQQRRQGLGDPALSRGELLRRRGGRRGVPAAPMWLSDVTVLVGIPHRTGHRLVLRTRGLSGSRWRRLPWIRLVLESPEQLEEILKRTGREP